MTKTPGDTKNVNIAILVVGVLIAGIVGYSVLTSINGEFERTQEWCSEHNGNIEFSDEVLYCDLPEKDVLGSDIQSNNYPENASTLPHTNMADYTTPAAFSTGEITAIVILTILVVGIGSLLAVMRPEKYESEHGENKG